MVSKRVSDGQESVSVAGKSRSQAGGSGGDGRLALVGWASEFRAPSLWGSFESLCGVWCVHDVSFHDVK